MSTAKWKWITFKGAKPHMVCAGLAKAIETDLLRRGHMVKKSEDAREFSIDMPGMIMVGRPIETFVLRGLRVDIPSEDVTTFIGHLGELEPRTAGKRTYYKLHGFLRCWVLTDNQHAALTHKLKSIAVDAERRAAAFYADKKSPAEALRMANARATGTPLEQVPDLGGHRLDRFFGERGES